MKLTAFFKIGVAQYAAMDAGEHFEPTPANIEARTQRFTIGDGLKVALLPKRTRGATVVVDAGFRFGDNAAIGVIEFVDRDVSAKGAEDRARREAEEAQG